MKNITARRDELIKTMMWRVAHLDADDIGDYQQELEDLFDAAISELKPEIERLAEALDHYCDERCRADVDLELDRYKEFMGDGE